MATVVSSPLTAADRFAIDRMLRDYHERDDVRTNGGFPSCCSRW